MEWVRTTLGFLTAAVALTACGDDGRAAGTAGGTGTTSAPGTSSTGVTPTTGDDATSTPVTGEGSNSNSNTQGATTGEPTTSLTGTGGGITSTTTGATTGEPGTTTTATTGALDPCGGTMGAVDFSYLWIANTGEGSISKIKTLSAANCGVYGRIQAVG